MADYTDLPSQSGAPDGQGQGGQAASSSGLAVFP